MKRHPNQNVKVANNDINEHLSKTWKGNPENSIEKNGIPNPSKGIPMIKSQVSLNHWDCL